MMIENKEERKIPSWLILLLAASCGLIVANLYYSQPLVGPISKDTGISPGLSGLIVTMTQLGYAAGLLFLVPLSDLLENRKLTVCTLLVAIVGLLMAPLAKNTELFFLSAVFIGAGSVAAQVLVPFAAHLAPAKERGKAVGNVMSGLLLGIMLARPAASLITGYLGWRAVYYLSAVIMVVLTVVLSRLLPKRNPKPLESYQKSFSPCGISFVPSLSFAVEPFTRQPFLEASACSGPWSPCIYPSIFIWTRRRLRCLVLQEWRELWLLPLPEDLRIRGIPDFLQESHFYSLRLPLALPMYLRIRKAFPYSCFVLPQSFLIWRFPGIWFWGSRPSILLEMRYAAGSMAYLWQSSSWEVPQGQPLVALPM